MENQIRENIRKNIARYRKVNGYTQKELADIVGVKNSTVSNWEQGANSPDIEMIFSLCQLFKVSVAEMYGCDTVHTGSSLTISGIERDIILAYRKADDIGKAMVLRALGIEETAANIKRA